jgi:hypothetical protein
MRMLTFSIVMSALEAVSASGEFAFPAMHGPDEYPDAMNKAWGGALTQAFVAYGRTLGELPFLPEITTTKVTMNDGAQLSTTVVNPYPHQKKKGTVVCRSPYGPLSSSLALVFVATTGYVAVMQDDRGTFTSNGTFDMWRTAGGDGLQTLEWIVAQPWSNGEVYSVGVSADGMNEIAMILQKPPMLKGQWWAWTTGNGHPFVYPHGIYRQDLLEGYMHIMSLMTHGTSVSHVIPEVRSHEAWSDWWYNITDFHAGAPAIDHFGSVDFPVVSSSGWWDIFAQSQLDDFAGIMTKSHPSVRDKHVLIVGPLGHCLMGLVDDVIQHSGLTFESVSSLLVSAELAAEFFTGNTNGPVRSRLGRINLFVMGAFDEPSSKDWWTSLDDWPAFRTSTLYLQSDGSLSSDPAATVGSVKYTYDPAKPTPMLGGGSIPFVCSTKGHCGTSDQLSREKRDDVVVFDSEELHADLPVVGDIRAKLFVSSSAVDTDFVVTLSDLSPGVLGSSFGKKSMLVRYGAVRMRWRRGDMNQSEPMSPEIIYEIDVDLMTVAYIFPRGHTIRLDVSSAAAPFYNPSKNNGKFEPHDDTANDAVVALNAVHFGPQHRSSVSLPVVNKSDIPPNRNFYGTAGLLKTQTNVNFV